MDPRQETIEEVLARWVAGTPGGHCLLCQEPLKDETPYRVPRGEFRAIVEKGYDPFARGRVHTSKYPGLLAADAYRIWKGLHVDAFAGLDQDICEACARDVASFVTQS